jgi:Ran GTPase-activating protein (RanGAP) involved in mRNA processing and transport
MPELSALEAVALSERLQYTRARLRELRGGDTASAVVHDEHLPTVALCTSGGGPRSFLCTVLLMDALARRRLLDVFAYHAGLSGSSWVMASWMGSSHAGKANVFYPTAKEDPWMLRADRADMSISTAGDTTDALDTTRLLNIVSAPFVSKLARNILSGQPMQYWEEHLRSSILDPLHGPAARTLKLSQMCRREISEGKMPIPLCTAVADGAPPDKYDWLSFTPFEVTRYGGGHSTTRPWESLQDYTLPQLLAIWGSAFAFDWEAAPPNLKRLVPARYNDPFLASLGGKNLGVTSDPHLGRLRDAGIASNVPIPVLLRGRTGRPIDIIVVMDATGLNKGEAECCQLWRHRDKLPWLNEAEVHRRFAPDEIVRVFTPPTDDDPIILYTLGYQTKASFDSNYNASEIVAVRSYMARVAAGIENALTRILHRYTPASPHQLNSPLDPTQASAAGSGGLEFATRLGGLYRRYFRHMGMLHVAGTASRLPFTSTYTPLTMTIDSSTTGRRGGSETVKLLELAWPEPPAEDKRNFWLVVGTAGVGKSTLSIQIARDQAAIVNSAGWPFAAVLRISCHVLATLAHQTQLPMIDLVAAAAVHDPNAPLDKAATDAPTEAQADTKEERAASSPVASRPPVTVDEVVNLLRTRRCLLAFDGFDEAQFDTRMLRIADRFFKAAVDRGDEWARDVLLTTRPQHDPTFFLSATKRLSLNPWGRVELQCYVDNYARWCRFLDVDRTMALLSRTDLASLTGTPLMAELLCHMVAQSLDGSTVSARAALAYCIGCLMERRGADSKAALPSGRLLDRLQEASVAWHRLLGRWDWLLDPAKQSDRAVLTSGFVLVIGRDVGEQGERLRAALVHQTLAEYLTSRHICTGGIDYVDTGITLGKLDEVVLACLADPAFDPTKESPLLDERDNGGGSNTSLVIDSPQAPRRTVSRIELRDRLTKRFVKLINEITSDKGPHADFVADLERNGATNYTTRAKWRDRLKIDRIMSFLAATGDKDTAKAVIEAYIPTYLRGLISPRKCLAPLLSEAAASFGATVVLDVLRHKKLLDAQRAVLEAETTQQLGALRNLLTDRVAPTLQLAESCGNAGLVENILDSMRHPVTGTLPPECESEVLNVAIGAARAGRSSNIPLLMKYSSNASCLELLATLSTSGGVDPWAVIEKMPSFAHWLQKETWVMPVLDAMHRRTTSLVLSGCDVAALSALLPRMAGLVRIELFSVVFDATAARALATSLSAIPALNALVITHSNLDDTAAHTIAQSINDLRSLTLLDLSDNAIGWAGAAALGAVLKTNAGPNARKLGTVDLSRNPLGDGGVNDLLAGVTTVQSIRRVVISGCGASAGCAASLAILLRPASPFILDLDLSKNPFGSSGCANIITELMQCKHLREVNLRGTGVDGYAAAQPLSVALPHWKNLGRLDLSENPLGDQGVSILVSGLRQLRSLRELTLVDIGLTSASANALGQALVEYQKLACLNVGFNRGLGDAGATALFSALAGRCVSLHSLVVRDVGMGPQSCGALADLVSRSPGLAWLDTGLNPIADEGFDRLGLALAGASCLVGLDLMGCGLSDISAYRLVRNAQVSSTLRVVRAQANDFTAAGHTLLATLGTTAST